MSEEPVGEIAWICSTYLEHWRIFPIGSPIEWDSTNITEPTGDSKKGQITEKTCNALLIFTTTPAFVGSTDRK